MKTLYYTDLGFIDYSDAWDLQKEIFELRHKNIVKDTLFLLEHPNTYTLGKTANADNLISSSQFLDKHNIKIFNIDRGGDITYHGPGQIVGYPIINLEEWYKDAHKYLRGLEEVIIKCCTHFGLKAERNTKYTGVWIENRKIAAIGVKLSRWITMHGFAFNVNTDLSLFSGIVPCGIKEQELEVTSLKKELKTELEIQEIKQILLNNFIEVFSYDKLNIIKKENIDTLN